LNGVFIFARLEAVSVVFMPIGVNNRYQKRTDWAVIVPLGRKKRADTYISAPILCHLYGREKDAIFLS